MIAFLLTPIGRYAAIAAVVTLLAAGMYIKVRHDAQADVRATAAEDALRRIRDATDAANNIPIDPSRLRDPDSHERHE
jgi:hypothetical protein